MARKFTEVLLSGSTGGRPIKVVATATAGTTVHATGTSSSVLDNLYVWAHNSDTVARTLTIEFGGVTDPDDLVVKQVSVPSRVAPMMVLAGQPLAGTGSAARTVAAFASAASVITLTGYVARNS